MLSAMRKFILPAILGAGVVLFFFFGNRASVSPASIPAETFGGLPAPDHLWISMLGLIGIVVGGFLSLYRRNGN